jgi:hypothetical protein
MKQYRYVEIIPSRHGNGKFSSYYRRITPLGSKRVPLPGPIGSPEWRAAYAAAAANAGNPVQQPRAKIERESKRIPPRIGVYLLMLDGEIVYVGTSRHMPTRVKAHRSNGRLFDRAYFIGAGETERYALETLLIRLLRPKQNRDYTTGPARV